MKSFIVQNSTDIKMNKLENFPPVYYVTLEECIDRQKLLQEQFAKYGIIPNAVISKRFSESDDIITGKYLYQLTGPTQGCIVSHLKAIKRWYESEESEYAFFCEDDLSLKTVSYWNFKWEEFIEKIPEDCECVQLMTIRGDFDGVYFRERLWDDWSETAYIMTRNYAKKIIDNYCPGDTFNLEVKGADIMPIGENILFTNLGKVYTFPLFVENVEIPTTDVNDLELKDNQKPNHYYASEYVYDWWKTNGKITTINEIMPKTNHSDKKNIVDCFSYFNEKELLELRVRLLEDYVDKFVITEANYTHSGIPKEYTLKETIKELGLPEDKIEVIEIDLSNDKLGPSTKYEKLWESDPKYESREKLQRDAISQCLQRIECTDDTMFIVSDCDEIINPKYLDKIYKDVMKNPHMIFKADLVHLEGSADLRSYLKESDEVKEWRYSLFFCNRKHMERVSLSFIRGDIFNPYEIVWPYEGDNRMLDIGWHFSLMGSNEVGLEKENSSSEVDCILKPYSVANLPHIIFELPKVKEFLLPNSDQKSDSSLSEIEELLYAFSMNTEDAETNFNLGLWYEKEGHTAPSLSYFLRCAERSEDDDLAYEGLLKSHHSYDRQGTRDGTAISLLQQAICLCPKRPEAYFLLARFHERRQQWNDSYKYASLGLDICDFDYIPTRSDVEYPGKYGLLYEKAVSGYWWGKGDQSRSIFRDLLINHKISELYKQSIIENLTKINGEIPEEFED